MRTKRNPLNEGSLREIAIFLINPSLKRALNLEDTWQTDTVSVKTYKARRFFRMPGLLYIAGAVKIQGIGYRDVKSGLTLWVRKDDRQSTYDVEFQGGQGGAEQVFCLSAQDWYLIAKNLIDKP